jgi:hypothetical protein
VFVLWHGTAVSCLLSRCNRHIGRGRTRPGPQSQRLADKSQQAPEIREDCEKNECKEPAKHFQHCSEKVWHHLASSMTNTNVTKQVEAGKGWHGEDCVEEVRPYHKLCTAC